MYFSNEKSTQTVAAYRVAVTGRELAKATHDHLAKSAEGRRSKRAGTPDAALEAAAANLAKLDRQLAAMREELALMLYEVARGAAKKFDPKGEGMDRDDFVQSAVIYTLSRVHHFDPNRGTSLLSWLTRCVRNNWGSPERKYKQRQAQFQQYAEHKRGELEAKQELGLECELFYEPEAEETAPGAR